MERELKQLKFDEEELFKREFFLELYENDLEFQYIIDRIMEKVEENKNLKCVDDHNHGMREDYKYRTCSRIMVVKEHVYYDDKTDPDYQDKIDCWVCPFPDYFVSYKCKNELYYCEGDGEIHLCTRSKGSNLYHNDMNALFEKGRCVQEGEYMLIPGCYLRSDNILYTFDEISRLV